MNPFIPCPFTYGDMPQGGQVAPLVVAARDPSNTIDKNYSPGYFWLSDATQGGSGSMFYQGGFTAGTPAWTLASSVAGALNTLSDGTITVSPSGGNIAIVGTPQQLTVTGSVPAHELVFSFPNNMKIPGALEVAGLLTLDAGITIAGGVTITGGLTTDTLTSTGATTLATTGASTNTFGNTTGATGLTLSVGTNNFVQQGAATSTAWISKGQTTGATLIGGTAQTGPITVGSSSGAGNSVLIADGGGAATVSIANVSTTGCTVNIMEGINTVANVFNLCSGAMAGDNTVNILNGNATAGVLACNIFGSTAATTGGTVNIGTGAAAHTVNIGNATAATAAKVIIKVGTGSSPDLLIDGITTSTYKIGPSTTSGTIAIGGTAQTGATAITLGSSSGTSTVIIQGGAGASTTLIGGGTGAANTTSINNGATAQNSTINLMAGAMTAGTHAVNILTGNSSGGTETFNLATGTGAAAINIGTGATGVKTIAIGGTAANVITVGNTQTTGSITIGDALTSGTITLGGTAGTGTITIGKATNATGQTVSINSGASIAGTNIVSILSGATPAASQTLNIMTGVGSAGTYAVNILTGASTGTTQTIALGTGAARTDITLGGTGANVIKINDTTLTGTFSVGNAMTTGTIQIGGATQTGATAIIIGPSTAAGGATFQFGNAANTGAQVINIASGTSASAASTVNLLNGTTPAATTTFNVMNGAASAGTPAINMLSTGATRAGTVSIGNGAAAHVCIFGSTSGAAATTINSGTGNLTLVGNVLKSTAPAFLSYLAGTVTNKTGAGTAYTIGTDALTEVFDRGSNASTAGVFTAPVTGLYWLKGQVTCTGATIATTFVISIVATSRTAIYTFIKAAGAQDETVAIDSLFDMTATDTAHVNIAVTGEGGDTVDIVGAASLQTYFTGYLVA